MDPLDRLAEPGLDLLRRVDALLATGAPEGHRVWPLLRRMQVLPGAAVRSFLELPAAAFSDAGRSVRQLVRGYDEVSAALTEPVPWSGAAGTAFGENRAALLRHLDEGPESLVGRLESTAGYADAIAEWIEGSRRTLARTLAGALGSAEAVAVVAATSAPAAAPVRFAVSVPHPAAEVEAAEIAARVLAVLSAAYDGAETLLRHWGPNLAESPWRAPVIGTPRYDTPTHVGW
ncbi:hypothetical protein [Salinispora sp. H7-4]|uniref:hypothetical protein n=1 Tax=Salinispora sp. H7-4 TaxID=2748321 RepID=UPI0015D374F2|nr:hypothetical protein [Salinispora sp. H7-4]NYT93175.1 hypothetical protein [Salinispora sp. H7-4]